MTKPHITSNTKILLVWLVENNEIQYFSNMSKDQRKLAYETIYADLSKKENKDE